MRKEDTLYDKLIHRYRYNILRNFLEINKNDILKALANKVRYIDIYNEFIENNELDINYKYFCQILSEFRIKHIYNMSEQEYNKQIEAITQANTPKEKEQEYMAFKAIQIAEKPAIKENIQATEKQVVDTKLNDYNTGTLSKAELKRLKLQQLKNKDNKVVDIQANQEKFVWKPSVKE